MKLKPYKIFLLLILFLVGSQVYLNLKIPKNIGLDENKFKKLKKTPNGVSSQSENPDKYIPPFPMLKNKDYSEEIIKRIINKNFESFLIKETNNYLHFSITSKKMHFKDDIEFYFDSKNNKIHFKSQSRIGYSDLGVNKKRYEKIKKLYLHEKEKTLTLD